MNNNGNRNSNRRRGRGNRNQGGSGGNQQNRIDSRARGNAPQLLDKYKKLAQDAAHNGDRVLAEYYLQFADHYFRVIADNKARQEEARGRRDERDLDDEEGAEFAGDSAVDQAVDERRRDGRHTTAQQRERSRRDEYDALERGIEGEEFSAEDNPFAPEDRYGSGDRTPRSNRGEMPDGGDTEERGTRRSRRRNSRETAPVQQEEQPDAFDVAALPPSISSADGDAPRSRLRPRRRRPAGEAEQAVEAVES